MVSSMAHIEAYARLAGGTPDRIHEPAVVVPRPAHCCFDPCKAKYCITREGFRLFFETHGLGPTRLLLVMGLAAMHLQWEQQLRYFGIERPDLYTICVFDGRGIGFSDDQGGRWRTTDLAADCVDLVRHLGWDTCHIVGFSLGGMVALETVLAAPDLFQSVTLISSNAGGLLNQIPPLRGWQPFVKTFGSLGGGQAIQAGLDLLYPKAWLDLPTSAPLDEGAPATVCYERGRELVIRARKYVEAGVFEVRLRSILQQIGAVVTHYVSRERLQHIKQCGIPALLICGVLDNLVAPSNSSYMAKEMCGRLVQFEDAGHGCLEQHAQQVNEAIAQHVHNSPRVNHRLREARSPSCWRRWCTFRMLLLGTVLLMHRRWCSRTMWQVVKFVSRRVKGSNFGALACM